MNTRSMKQQAWVLVCAAILATVLDGAIAAESAPREVMAGASVERMLPGERVLTPWVRDPAVLARDGGDRMEESIVDVAAVETVKLTDVIAPIHFDSGLISIRDEDVEKVRRALENVRDKANVRLHLVGHADSQALSGALAARYGDNAGLSRERAGEVAELLQRALNLPSDAVAFEGVGDTRPVAGNETPAGRAQNRRVEVEVWYDEPRTRSAVQETLVQEEIHQIKVCRVQTLCTMRFRDGMARRARVKNMVSALRFGEEGVDVTPEFIEQMREAFANLGNKSNVTAKFIGYTDDAPLSDRNARIYGDAVALSKARARRVELAVQEALGLPSAAVQSDGRGATAPLAPNDTAQGRALNRRIEVQFWHDDPLQELPEEPQLCPEDGNPEMLTRVYQPSWGSIPVLQLAEGGNAVIPPGLTDVLRHALDDIRERRKPRLRFVGYTGNQRLDRRTAAVYGDDIGLSAERARRAKDAVRAQMQLMPTEVEHEGRGYVQSADVVSEGFTQGENSYVVVQVVYDEPAISDDLEGVDVTRLTRELTPRNAYGLNPLHITVDGKPIDDPGRSSADVQRCTDVALDAAHIRFQFDGLKAAPRLSVAATPESTAGEPVRFRMYSNYGAFIGRAEVRIIEKGQSAEATPIAIVPLSAEGFGEWQPQVVRVPGSGRELQYLLRAYGADDVFDDTVPRSLWLVPARQVAAAVEKDATPSDGAPVPADTNATPSDSAPVATDADATPTDDAPVVTDTEATASDTAPVASDPAPGTAPVYPAGVPPGYGESTLARRNIALGNNTIAVRGSGIPAGHSVWVAGRAVPVDAKGNFAAEEILPAGLHTVEVAVLDPEGNGKLYLRDMELQQRERFYVGIADLTVSQGSSSGPMDLLQGANAPYDPDSTVDARLAFYGTEKFGDDWRLTASADTREGPVEDIFSNFLDKAPDSLFRRIDPDYHYPTFGDDGAVEEMAPTLGKFYLRADHGDDYLLWGSFNANYAGNELARIDRGLYGAQLAWTRDDTTGFGERRAAVGVFAAQPGTVAGRDEFRGTGGSLFYLRNQDILTGSEHLRIELRDKDSHLVMGNVELRPGLDYDIDYLQGRILLAEPLSAIAADSQLVRSGGLSGEEAWLVARYEYTPGFADIDTLTTGGQGHVWINDYIGVGLTASNANEDAGDAGVQGADVTLRMSSESWLKLQGGRSQGLASNSLYSVDGGFGFTGNDPSSFVNAKADSYRADLSVGAGDFIDGSKGRLTLYTQSQDAGYSAPGLATLNDRMYWGGTLELPIGTKFNVAAKGDKWYEDLGLAVTAMELDLGYNINDHWSLGTGVRNDDRIDRAPVVAATQEQGERTDAVLHVGYDSGTTWRAWGFAQQTVSSTGDREDNGRVGAGGAVRLGEKLRLEAEASSGDRGPGGRLGTNYMVTDQTSLYLNYALEDERDAGGVLGRRSSLVSGVKRRLADSGSVYMEERYQDASAASSLTHAAGVTLGLASHWTIGANAEVGTLEDSSTGAETDRKAGGVRVAYAAGATQVSSGVEYLSDDREVPDGSRQERSTWLFRNNFKYEMTPDWRVVGKFDYSMSDSSQGQFYDGKFTEAVLGFGYRPVLSNRLNTLLKYTYFYNMPTSSQVTLTGSAAEFLQKSHIASLDATFDVNQYWSIGGKYAYRLGAVSMDRENPLFFDNSAQLVILRADLRLFEDWEAVVEGRVLQMPDLDETRSGALLGVYRRLGEHVKVGLGYNFTDFSEDLTDLSYTHHGAFLNIVGAL